ncbi:hypothetical protein FS842_000406 [Serendipita sp. 407]|nr:hypothetical protein FS842_000406 [Serendipita sp. 407]
MIIYASVNPFPSFQHCDNIFDRPFGTNPNLYAEAWKMVSLIRMLEQGFVAMAPSASKDCLRPASRTSLQL